MPADKDRGGALAVSQEALAEHVRHLAGEIGERNLWRPAALAEAAEYVEATWRGQGYQVARQCYEVRGISSANLEIGIPGRTRPGEILLIGAHYDTVAGSPGANDNGLVSNLRSRRVMRAFVRAFRARSDFPLEHVATFGFVPGVTWSDHRSFWDQGYRAFMATDTAPYRYPDYHGCGDRPDKLNYPAFARATEGLWRSFRAVATEGLAGW